MEKTCFDQLNGAQFEAKDESFFFPEEYEHKRRKFIHSIAATQKIVFWTIKWNKTKSN